MVRGLREAVGGELGVVGQGPDQRVLGHELELRLGWQGVEEGQQVNENGVNQHTEGVTLSHPTKDRGNSQSYLAGRLKRDHPEIVARVEAKVEQVKSYL